MAMPTAMPEDAVDEQVGEAARQDDRLAGLAVVVRLEVDRLLVDVPHHLHGERGEPAFGVVADEAVRDERVVVGVDAERRRPAGRRRPRPRRRSA